MVKIRRDWDDYEIGTVEFEDLESLSWDTMSGGLHKRAPQPFVYGYVFCDRIRGEISHSGIHGECPHYIKVCVVKKDNTPEDWKKILEIVGPKPKRI